MKCYAVGTRFGKTPFQWVIPGSDVTRFFAQRALETRKKEIISFCDELEDNETHRIQKDGYFVHIKKIGNDVCAIIVDKELSDKEMLYLSFHLLKANVEMSEIAENPDKYTEDPKIATIKRDLAETLQIMLENLEKTKLRGEKLEHLVATTQDLEASSFRFKKSAEDLNSCWPRFCTLI
ncbi:Synaptobrevin [Legionella lansingensis]|uniref:Synaptobrevin n=1 Tax=Legionella lansingensis TaxID=45067 RepID=A0A0W0VKH5_9GAMM|nr:hypothetical protein [Legionella lansingensis]KTD20592.1 Synaptobrevin [Legionella lansingensis]SNV46269.1 Synaptobrevin [Legionella lansingensis]